jgi:hypothetical protein
MLVNVLLPAFTPEWYAAPVLLSRAETLAPIHAAASAAQVASCLRATRKPAAKKRHREISLKSEISRRDVHYFYAYSARLLLFACS